MKTLLKLSTVCALALLLVLGSAFSLDRDTFSAEASVPALSVQSDIIASGCVGQCGFSFSTSAEVPGSGAHTYQFKASSDLCSALGAKAFLMKNGSTVFVGDVEEGMDMTFTVKGGDVIQLSSELFLKQRKLCNPRGQVDMKIIALN